ncbi:thimet oligopeptidase [Trypanosoma cruzi]|nr:thimet oligopeptidase [Trypanosoma cruzi]
MSGSTPGTEFRHTEKRLSRGVCAFLLEFLSVRPPDCGEEAHMPGIDAVLREWDRAMTASASALTLRGAPRRHGENVESTVRTRSASESGTVKISSLTSSCTARIPRKSASILCSLSNGLCVSSK